MPKILRGSMGSMKRLKDSIAKTFIICDLFVFHSASAKVMAWIKMGLYKANKTRNTKQEKKPKYILQNLREIKLMCTFTPIQHIKYTKKTSFYTNNSVKIQ